MKLKLINFRCFKDFELQIPEDNGNILLWGTSGIGKTTIFKAINFSLYGKEQKVVKHGEKKCKVVFEFKDIIITRTRVPNHLTFQKGTLTLEDDSAQREIEKIFGYDFLLTGYMAQKGTENFFNLTNNEKSAFLHKLSLKNFDVESIRKKTRDLIKQRKDKLLVNSTEQKMVKASYESLNCSSMKEPKIKIDLKGKSIIEFMEIENKLRDKVKKSLKEKGLELSRLSADIELFKINSARIEEKTKSINDISFKLQDYSFVDNIEPLKETMEEYKKIVLYYTLKKNCKDLKNEYDKMIEDERKKINEDISKLKDKRSSLTLLNDEELEAINKAKYIYDKTKLKNYTDIKNKITELKDPSKENKLDNLKETLKTKRETITLLQVEIENIKKNIKDIKDVVGGDSKYKCPKCNTNIYIEGDCLKEISGNVDELKASLKDLLKLLTQKEADNNLLNKEIKKINDDILSLTMEVSNNIKLHQELTEYLKTLDNIKIYENLNTLKNTIDKDTENRYTMKSVNESINKLEEASKLTVDVLPHYIKKKRDEVISIKKKYEDIKEQLEDVDIKENVSYYQDQIQEINQRIYKYEQSIKERNKLLKEKESIEREISSLTLTPVDEELIKTIREEIEKKTETEEKLKLRETKLLKYKEDLALYTSQKEVVEKLDSLKAEESILIRGLSTAETLLKKINDAESYSLEHTLDNINTDLEEFVSKFFGENFSVKLQSFKESKDGDKKPSIEVIIMQDGEQVPIESLSGGEFDRLSLALFLCFNKTSKSDIILLDECLASLHSELVEDIVELIRNKLSDKLVIFTLHQANTGIFDTIIDIEKLKGNI
jgi:DNA repair exonuclease SbcCD ATPase subunit